MTENPTDVTIESYRSNRKTEEFYKLKKSLYKVLLNREMKDSEYLNTQTSYAGEMTTR